LKFVLLKTEEQSMRKVKERRLYTIEGLEVRNLKHKIRLTISDEDCKKGNKKAPGSCAAALAATRQIPHCHEARIHIGRVFLKMGNGNKKLYWLRGKTTGALRTEIATFDRGGTFEPGIYDINPLTTSELPTGKRIGHHPPRFGRGRPGKHRRSPKVLRDVRGSGRKEYAHK